MTQKSLISLQPRSCAAWLMLCGGTISRQSSRVHLWRSLQGEQTPEALAMAVEDAIGRLPQHPADQLDALFGCLSHAMPTLPGRPNFMQEMLGLEVTEVRLFWRVCRQAHQIKRHDPHMFIRP